MSDGRSSIVALGSDASLSEYRALYDRQDCPAIRLDGLGQLVAFLDSVAGTDISHVTLEPCKPDGRTMAVSAFVDFMRRRCAAD